MNDSRYSIEDLWARLAPWFVVVAGLVAYYNTFGNPFIFDDAFVSSMQPEWPRPGTWFNPRALVNFTFLLNCLADGQSPAGYHAVNVAIHIASALFLYGIVRRTLRRLSLAGWTPALAQGVATVSALLWVVHPLQTESVTYICQRYESMMGLMLLLTLYGFVRSADSARPVAWLAVSVVSGWLGMTTKEVMVVAPLLVMLYDYIFGSDGWRGVLRHWRFHGLLAMSWVFLFLMRHHAMSDAIEGGYALTYPTPSPWVYLINQPGVILHYLRLAVLPTGLCLDYAWPVADSLRALLLPTVAMAFLGGLTLAALWCRRPAGYLGAWFFVILAPSSSVVPVHDLAFEHRMYLPLAAVVVLAVAGATHLLLRVGRDDDARKRSLVIAGGAAAVIGLLFLAGTVQRNRTYASAEAMWRDVLRKAPHNLRQQVALAGSLNQERRYGEAEALARDVVGRCRAMRQSGNRPRHPIAATDPNVLYPEALQQLGLSLLNQGDTNEAIECFREGAYLTPTRRLHHNLGVALMQAGRTEEAIGELDVATRLGPGSAVSWELKAHLLSQVGRFREAVQAYGAAVVYDPNLLTARVELAWLLATCADETIRDGRRAVGLAESAIERSGGRSTRALEVLDAARREAARSAHKRGASE